MLLLLLIISESLTFAIIRIHYKSHSRTKYYLSMVINTSLSIFLWIIYLGTVSFTGQYDEAYHIWLKMNLNGAICAILVPRILLIILHFSGVLINIRKREHLRPLTDTGFIVWFLIIAVVAYASWYERFNVKTEKITVYKEGLHPDLEGFTIVQISDLHLAGFYGHQEFLKKQMEFINSCSPDIIINSGDFTSYGWREFGRMDTVLGVARSRLGNYAVYGNHDMGTYHPGLDYAGRELNIIMIKDLIQKSGYKLLANNNILIKKGDAVVGIAGITTSGRHGHIRYGNLSRALQGTDSAHLKILISHDPDHWLKEVAGKTSVDLTLSGHTHGMQVGIYTKGFRWSPSKYFYPQWNGLYRSDNQWLYVNRGLGVLGVPLRIWMPPEITVIKITGRL
ncbi:MAG: metallophosphoesterase [Bacteroidales bacterium]